MLPQGYTRVEWIQSTGTQYINTRYKPNNNTRLVMECTIENPVSSNYITLFGARDADLARCFALFVSPSNNFYPNIGIKTDYYTYPTSISVVGHHVIDANKNTITIDESSHTFTARTFQNSTELFIFANNENNSATFYGAFKTETVKIYGNGAPVRDYIPCIDGNGDANIWDDVNETLAEKEGTFLYGAALVPEALSELVQIDTQAGTAFSWKPSEYANEYVIARDGVKIATVYGNVTSYTDTDAPGLSTYTVTPYNGKQAGAGASITILAKLDAPGNLNAAIDGLTVTLTWSAVSGAEGYKVYRDGGVVASVASTSYTDTLIPPASVAYAVSAYAGTIQSETSRAVVVENWEGVLLTLITDRTAADVAEAKRLRDKLIAGEVLNDEESARYFAGLRGCYNASDMNRVGAAVRYVANRLNAEGYGAHVSPKTDWQMEYAVRQSDWNKYLDEVRHLRRKLTLMRTTPQITDGMYSGLKSYAEANAIEQILVDLDWMLTNIIRNYIYAGEVFAGEV